MDSPDKSMDNPINLRAVARRARDDFFRANRVERFQTLSRETVSRFLLGTHDKILSNDNWLEGEWYLAD